MSKPTLALSSVTSKNQVSKTNEKLITASSVRSNDNLKLIVEDKIAPHNHGWFLKTSNTMKKTKLRKKQVPLLYAMREESRMKTEQKAELGEIIKELPKQYKIDIEFETQK